MRFFSIKQCSFVEVVYKLTDGLFFFFRLMQTSGLRQLLFEGGGNILNHLSANEKQHFIHIHVFTDALALRCTLEARLRTQLVERRRWWAHRSDRAHSITYTQHALSLGMLWFNKYKLFLMRNLSQRGAAPNSDEPLTLDLMIFRSLKRNKRKRNVSLSASDPHRSAMSGRCSLHHTSDGCFTVWSGFFFKPVPSRTDGRRYLKLCLQGSHWELVTYLLFLTVEAWTVDRVRRPAEIHHGVNYL